jgi:hypothetical protein
MAWRRAARCAVGAVLAAAAACGGTTTGTSIAGDPRGAEDGGARNGSGSALEAGLSAGNGGVSIRIDASVPAQASGATSSGGNGGVLFHIDASASPSGATGSGGRLEPPFDDAGLAECDDLRSSARRDLTAAISLSCSDDSECALFDAEAECSRGCPVAGRADSAASLEKAIAAANQGWCVTFQERGCPLFVPECVLTRAACVTGSCQLSYSDLYRFDITNPIDSGETVVATKLDGGTGDCVVAEFFVQAGDPAPRLEHAWLIPKARSCCPLAAYTLLAACETPPPSTCAWPAAAPDPSGTGRIGPNYTLDLDYTLSFPAVPLDVEFRATGLVRGSCP